MGLVIPTNRLPIKAKVKSGQVNVEQTDGGLVRAVGGVHSSSSVWFGYHELPESEEEAALVRSELRRRCLRVVEIPAELYNLYYNEFCNRLLWPLFHSMPHLVRHHHTLKGWNASREVNKLFAQALLQEARDGDVVWIHDYHLVFLPAMLRKARPELKIGFFLHIPFPSMEMFLRGAFPSLWFGVISGMMGADLIGFHTQEYLANFLESARYLECNGQMPRMGVFPVGVNAHELRQGAYSPEVDREVFHLRERYRGQQVLLGIDRLDYIKGIPERMRAFAAFLELYPEWLGKLVFVQIAVPSRQDIPEYRTERRLVEELVCDINSRFRVPGFDWKPVEYHYHSILETRLYALYRIADVCAVTSLRDGLNLVAKEFAAINTGGVLVLSKFAGAAQELRHVLSVDPSDRGSMVRAFCYALVMSSGRRQEVSHELFCDVGRNTNTGWAKKFLCALDEAHESLRFVRSSAGA